MRVKILILAVIAIALLSSIEIHASRDEIFINISFSEPAFEKVKIGNETYDRIIIEGLPNIGSPSLPVKTINVLIPYKMEVDKIEIKGKEIYLGEGYKIEENKLFPVKNGSNDGNSNSLYENAGIQYFRGYTILILNLYPIKYIPSTGEIYFYKEMKIKIHLKEGEENELFRGYERDREEVVRKVINPEMAISYKGKSRGYAGGICDPNESYEYVIITNEALNNTTGTYNWDDLISWKILNGLNATKVTVERINACPDYWNSNPLFNDTQAHIREFIKDAYLDWGTDYILLGGDADGADVGGESGDNVVPIRYLYAMYYEGDQGDQIPSDLYYACLDGNFNYDEDSYWGEPNDGIGGGEVDLFAEVYVGRAPVDSASEISNFVKKTIAYGNSNDAYLKKVLMVGEILDSTPTWGGDYKDEMIDGSSTNGYTTVGIPSSIYNISTLYDRDLNSPDVDYGYRWQKSELISIINSNVHLINHMGHSSVGYNMRLWYTDVDSLTNSQYFFLYSQGCYPGSIDNWHYGGYYTSYDCIGEHYVTSSQGAFACILNSRYGWYMPGSTNAPSQRMDREFWDAIYGENITEIGKANQDSKEDNAGLISISSYYRWCAYELNLLGDPSVRIKKPTQNPELSYYPSFYDFGNVGEGIYNTTFEIWNNGTGVLTWYLNDSYPWLYYEPVEGNSTTEHDVINVYVNTTGLSGYYNATIYIYSNGGNGSFNISFKLNNPPYKPYDPWPNKVMGVNTSVNLSCVVMDKDNDTMDVKFYWANGTLIGIAYNVSSGERAVIHTTLNADTYYEWYVVASDGMFEVNSSIWSFGTEATSSHYIYGYCYYYDNGAASNINITIINNCSNDKIYMLSNETGFYAANLGDGGVGWAAGVPICIAVNTMSWMALEYTNVPSMEAWINITLYPFIMLHKGWNLITLPCKNNYTASSLYENISGCSIILKWNASEQDIEMYVPNSPYDFEIEDGVGYLMAVENDTIFIAYGEPIENVSILLYEGWNCLGWFKRNSTFASSIYENISGSIILLKWNTTKSYFDVYVPSSPYNFEIKQGEGFFIAVDEQSIWHGEG